MLADKIPRASLPSTFPLLSETVMPLPLTATMMRCPSCTLLWTWMETEPAFDFAVPIS
jgi:hypothetical protein